MVMRFRNFGGIYQFAIQDEDDLAQIDALDFARWAATSAPLSDLHCDPAFLKYIDAEGTGRVRAGQLVAARDWLFERLARRSVVVGRLEKIPLDAIRDEGDGAKIIAAARRVNREQKAERPDDIALADVRAFMGSYKTLLRNGDGVIPPELAPEPDVADFLKDVMTVVGGVKDRGGADGVDAEHLETFKTRAQAWLDWRAKERDASPWGDDTAAAAALVAKLDPKIEEFFLHADLVRQEAPPEALLHLKEDDFRALHGRDAAAIEAHLRAAPLARADATGVLVLDPASVTLLYRDDLAALKEKVIARALGAATRDLTRASWHTVKALFDPYVAWQKAMPPDGFDKLGEEKVRAYLAGSLFDRAKGFMELDKAAAPEIDAVGDLEKLLLYVRWLLDLANNLVNFSAIYRPKETSLVEAGSLVIDGRRLEFCIEVHDRAKHKPIASESLIFLVYASVQEKQAGGKTFQIVAPVTGGEKGRLRVGKRGLFIDHHGKEWDAEIVEVVENPISVREAMFAPFRRAAKFVGDKIEEWVGSAAAAREAGLHTATAEATTAARTHVETTVAAPPAAPLPAPPAPGAGVPAERREGLNINSLVLGGGMALAGLGAVLAGLFGMLTSLRGWAAILGVVAAVMALSALNAWLKLRKRDMSVLLEASGWAVNVHTAITARIAKVFAFTPDLPKEAKLDHTDLLPAADEEGGVAWPAFVALVLAVAVAVAWYGRFKAHWF